MPFSLNDIKNSKVAHLNTHLMHQVCNKKKSKYRNTKTEVDGIVFDSKKEANRYKELKLLMKAGHIGLFERQKRYELNEGGTHSLAYIADFVYFDVATGKTIVEDTKGFKTKEYLKKKRLMKKIHGIIIFES